MSQRRRNRDELEGVINLCKAVRAGSVEPFAVEIDYMLSVIRQYYPEIKSLDEFCVDAEAIKGLSDVLSSQNEWIQHQSTTLYKDPFMLSQQLMKMDISAIADSFVRSWHPIVQMEQISAKTLANSIGYWSDLIPMTQRYQDLKLQLIDAGSASIEEAKQLGILPEKGFVDTLESFWHELEDRVGKGGKIPYWDWVSADSYKETVTRSYLTVFMVSYGYANVETDRFGENIVVSHIVDPRLDPSQAKISIPILVDHEEWEKWRKE